MNLKFNDKSDIDYHDRILGYLKEKNEKTTNFFSLIRLYNYLTKNKDNNLSFIASQKSKNFEGVNRTFESASSVFENLNLQSDEFVPSLAKYDKVNSETDKFTYTFKNTKDSGLNFIKICARPECVDEFLYKYKNEFDTYSTLGNMAEKEESRIYDAINTEYVDAIYQQDVKKLYHMLETFKSIVGKNIFYDKVAIKFERGFSWIYPMTFRMSNMLAKDGKEVDIKDTHNHNHVLYIENTPKGWLKFDKNILDDYYDEFSKICLHSQLNTNLSYKKSVKTLKI